MDAEGKYHVPFGRQTALCEESFHDDGGNVLVDGKEYAYIDGACEISLPSGSIHVEIEKGPEYRPLDARIVLAQGQLSLRFAMERWIDLRAEGWYSGDTGVQFITPHTALLEGAAEDLGVINLLARAWWKTSSERPSYLTYPNLTAFSGQRPALEMPGHLVVVNTLNCGGRLGNYALLNCHRVVYPLSFGDPYFNWTLADVCDQCHRKGGLVVWSPMGTARFAANLSYKDVTLFNFGEALADLVLGKVDAIEVEALGISCFPPHQEWYNYLNCGFRLPIVGSAHKYDNTRAVGQERTYAQLQSNAPMEYRNWIEAVRAGRTFVTNGPMLTLEVNGQGPGAVLTFSSEDRAVVSVHAKARSLRPIQRLEIILNGEVAATSVASGDPSEATVDCELPVNGSVWIAARCVASMSKADPRNARFVGAHTSPVYVEVENRPFAADPAVVRYLAEALDWWTGWLHRDDNYEKFETDEQRQRLANIFRSAREELLKRATV
jgi:hypothetical protein